MRVPTLLFATLLSLQALHAEIRAGAFAQDISQTTFSAPVNGSMKGNFATSVHDPMHARCLPLSSGKHEIIFCVVDACTIPREVCEQAKVIASRETGVPASHILISATHTHSAATMTAVFQSDPDPGYVAAVPARIAKGIGLDLKRTTPFTRHFTISLANGYNGYLPTKQHHEWGGYETWRARSSYLEVGVADKIVATLQAMLARLASAR